MTAIDRRKMLRILAGGAAVATAGLALIPDAAESAALLKSHLATPEVPVEEAVWVRRRRRCAGGAAGGGSAAGAGSEAPGKAVRNAVRAQTAARWAVKV